MKVKTLIIGSGVAATALSDRLLRANPAEDILLLEAGTKVKLKDFGLWENYVLTGKLPYERYWDLGYPQRGVPGENKNAGATEVPLNGARVIAYGGSTIHWGGWSLRLKPEDFRLRSNTTREQTGDVVDWPISYDDLEPYYGCAESYLGVSGDSTDATVHRSAPYPYAAFPFTAEDGPLINALKARGYDYGHMPIARKGVANSASRHAPCQTTGTCKYCPFGARYAAPNYLDEMRDWEDFPNFRIALNAIVETLIMDMPDRVAGAIYRDNLTGQTVRVEAERVIVAAGTIESAKLLRRSQSPSSPEGIGNNADLVGRFFITHPYFFFSATLPANPKRLQPEMDFPTLISRHFDSEAEQAKGKFVLVNPPASPSINLARVMQSGTALSDVQALASGKATVQLQGMVETFGRHDNMVANLDQRNRFGMLETSVDYSADPALKQRMDEIQSHVTQVFEQMGASITDKPSVSWRADHAACTCRMSKDPKDGVVDPNLKVHGIDNLYVCSNAVFCSLGAVNPTLTLTALALRLADHLKGNQT